MHRGSTDQTGFRPGWRADATNLVPGLFLFLPLQSRDDRSGTTEEVHAGNEGQIKVSVSIGTFASPS